MAGFWKPTPLKLIIAAVLGGGGYFVASNAHFDAFPCEKADYNFETERHDAPSSQICSLLHIKRSGEDPIADKAKLTGGGYAVMVLLFGLAPILVGFGIGHALRKKA